MTASDESKEGPTLKEVNRYFKKNDILTDLFNTDDYEKKITQEKEKPTETGVKVQVETLLKTHDLTYYYKRKKLLTFSEVQSMVTQYKYLKAIINTESSFDKIQAFIQITNILKEKIVIFYKDIKERSTNGSQKNLSILSLPTLPSGPSSPKRLPSFANHSRLSSPRGKVDEEEGLLPETFPSSRVQLIKENTSDQH